MWFLARNANLLALTNIDKGLGLGLNTPSMKRDDWLILISLVWFVGLCGAAAWVLTH
jgi:hypothetical protein